MKESVKNFLHTFFNEGESICISPNKFGHYSVPMSMIGDNVTLTQHFMDETREETPYEISLDEITMCAINPIDGRRSDSNVTKFRSFMLELDDMPIVDQKKYILECGIPYSVCVYSGNKSLHYGIVLDEDLPNEDMWRTICEWILNILTKADQQNKNPSRSIRFPDNLRKDSGRVQVLLENKGRVNLGNLLEWLGKYPNLNPLTIEAIARANKPITFTSNEIPFWVIKKLEEGSDERGSRNKYWFQIAMELAKRDYEQEQIENLLEQYFIPQRDFGRREWKTIITSAITRVRRGLNG